MQETPIQPALHEGEYTLTLSQVRHLITSQFPQYKSELLEVVTPGGTDHFTTRIGKSYTARLPRFPGSIQCVELEHRWLPLISGKVDCKVPVPIGIGNPCTAYPARWSVLPWLEGTPADRLPQGTDLVRVAAELGTVVQQIRSVPVPKDVPTSQLPTSYRVQTLHVRTAILEEALSRCDDIFDAKEIMTFWEQHLLRATPTSQLAFAHCDIQPPNIIVETKEGNTHLSGIIDWGSICVGDPAVDMLPAWALFDRASRPTFRKASGADTGMWWRGRAWALSIGIIAYAYYRISRPDHAEMCQRQVEEALADWRDD